MTLALAFATPLLLVGLAAAAIPLVLHLLASVRAPQEYFPTLRFLKMGMEKTARRRRLEHWLLLLIRSALLAVLAVAVAEPVLKSTAGFWSDKRFAAVIIVDNSYSMGVARGGESRFEMARREATKLLGGTDRPSAAALILTNSSGRPGSLQSNLEGNRRRLSQAHLTSGRADIAECVREALELLKGSTAPQKAVYIFSDTQRISFEHMPGLSGIKASGVPLMLVDCSDASPVNVGIEDIKISKDRVIGREMKFTSTLINSSPTDKETHVWLQVDGRQVGESARKILPAANNEGPTRTTVRFGHTFTTPGVHVGQVAVREADDLATDNVRRFSLRFGGQIRAVLVVGGASSGGMYDPARTLRVALDSSDIWSIRRRTVGIDRFAKGSLTGAQAVFFADVPSFTVAQAEAVVDFVRNGGSAVFFLGPAARASNYNKRFAGVLPGRIEKAVGQVGLEARGFGAVKNLRHPYLAGLFEQETDYPEIVIHRYYRLERLTGDHRNVLSSPDFGELSRAGGDPIISVRDFGAGRVVLAGTTASVEWNNLATTSLFLPIVTRICLSSGERLGADNTFSADSAVTIKPGVKITGESVLNVTMPDGAIEVLPFRAGSDPVFTKTDQPGIYRWKVLEATGRNNSQPGNNVTDGPPGRPPVRAEGAFAVNPDGLESNLLSVKPAALVEHLKRAADEAGDEPPEIYFGGTLEGVHAAAADAAAGDNLWDRLLVVVIVLLVVEAVAANRFRRGAAPSPAHLNPALAA
ncbi:MAG: VWA domain-containing protein [Planctomycetota bacterium]|nr:VWA domain-containing protein [Planctomycetota bacterium]